MQSIVLGCCSSFASSSSLFDCRLHSNYRSIVARRTSSFRRWCSQLRKLLRFWYNSQQRPHCKDSELNLLGAAVYFRNKEAIMLEGSTACTSKGSHVLRSTLDKMRE
jgi:hypothetical protein